ncbi:hypothetical protein B0H13DRAFT_1916997 [Mycena leptocephala]|nr:hypothetical protein B0H13DRAFT_1916997 [Mycena leptocephala]
MWFLVGFVGYLAMQLGGLIRDFHSYYHRNSGTICMSGQQSVQQPAQFHPRGSDNCFDAPSCKQKGTGIWALITAATTDKSPALTTAKFQASYVGGFTTTSVNRDVTGGLGNSITSVLNRVAISGAPSASPLFPNLDPVLQQQENTPYQILFARGLIVATYSDRMADPVPTANQVPWDVVAMELYKGYRGPDGPSDLKFVLRYHITNVITIGILEELYTASQMASAISADDSEWIRWDANDGACDTNAVLTLLGTDNGTGSGFILVDYAATIGGKRIVNIYTRRLNSVWHMATEYGPTV